MSPQSSDAPCFVSVPVPADRVQEVYALLAVRDLRNGQSKGALPGAWTRELIARMYRESPTPMKAFLLHLASHAEETFTAKQLAKEIRREQKEFAGVLGAFGRRVKNRYSMKIWPFRSEHSPEEKMFTYRMTASVAEIILEVASQS